MSVDLQLQISLIVLILTSTSMMGCVFHEIFTYRKAAAWPHILLIIVFLAMATVRAYDPIVYFGMQGAVACGCWQLNRWLERRRAGQVDGSPVPCSRVISLRSFLVTTVMVSLFLTAILGLRDRSWGIWGNLILAGTVSGLATVLASWAARSRSSVVGRWFAVALLSAQLAILMCRVDHFFVQFPDLKEWSSSRPFGMRSASPEWFVIVPGIVLVVALWIHLTCAVIHSPDPSESSEAGRMNERSVLRRPAAQVAWCVLSGSMCTPSLVAWIWLAQAPTRLPDKVPGPNGYDQLIRVAKRLPQTLMLDVDTATPSQLKATVAIYSDQLNAVRAALQRPCEKHLVGDYRVDDSSISGFRDLAVCFRAEGRLAELEGRWGDAMNRHLDIVRLSHAIDRGGNFTDWLVGRSLESMGLCNLAGVQKRVAPIERRQCADVLLQFECNREPLLAAQQRDAVWEVNVNGWPTRIIHAFIDDQPRGSESLRRCQALSRLIMLEDAIETYRRERGAWPDRLSDVRDGDHPEGILDPYSPKSEKPFLYIRDADRYLVYSRGMDGDDDRGEKYGDLGEEGDLRLDYFASPDVSGN